MTEPLTLATEADGLILRELSTLEDDQAYFEAIDRSRPHLEQFEPETSNKYRTVEQVTEARLNAKPNQLRMGIWAGEILVGSINLKGVELGYWLSADHLGRGYATMAARALTTYGIERYGHVNANVIKENTASSKVLERVGFSLIAEKAGSLILTIGDTAELNSEAELSEADKQALIRYQRLSALRKGEQIRMAKTAALKELKERNLSASEAIRDPRLQRSKVKHFLLANPRVGNTKAKNIMNDLKIKLHQRVDSLREDQIAEILKRLPDPDVGQHTKRAGNKNDGQRRAAASTGKSNVRYRNEIKRLIRAGKLDIESAIGDERLYTMALADVVECIPVGKRHFATKKLDKLFSMTGIPPTTICGELTPDQKLRLSASIRHIVDLSSVN